MLSGWHKAFYSRDQRLSQGFQNKPMHAITTCQPWLGKDVFTERTSREMLNILVGNYELSSKENLVSGENQNLLGSYKLKTYYKFCYN